MTFLFGKNRHFQVGIDTPREFVNNKTVAAYVRKFGPSGLPVVLVDGAIVITGRYPTNAEFVTLLELPKDMLHVS